jgi:hypothetical protein
MRSDLKLFAVLAVRVEFVPLAVRIAAARDLDPGLLDQHFEV